MINNFITQVKTRGLARINRYDVVIIFPTKADNDTVKLANLFCDSVTLPGINIATTAMRTFGETREMPYEKMYDPITISFYVDSGMKIKKAFEEWIDMISNPDTRTLGYYNDYTRAVEIYVRTVDGSTPYMLTLYEAYPKIINVIQMDASGRDVMKMSVTMQYRYWKSKTVDIIETKEPQTQIGRQDPSNVITGSGLPLTSKEFSGSFPSMSFDPPQSFITEI